MVRAYYYYLLNGHIFVISGYYILAIITNIILSETKLIFWSRLEGEEENGEKV